MGREKNITPSEDTSWPEYGQIFPLQALCGAYINNDISTFQRPNLACPIITVGFWSASWQNFTI